jgi:hypothetical protein
MTTLRHAALALAVFFVPACSSSNESTASTFDDSGAADAGTLSTFDDSGAADAGTLLRCSASLASVCESAGAPDLCPPSLESALPGPWCASNPRAGAILGACGGYAGLPEGTGTDGAFVFLYAADAGMLAAVFAIGDEAEVSCVGGNADVAIPMACFANLDINIPGPIAFSGAGGAAGCADAGGRVTLAQTTAHRTTRGTRATDRLASPEDVLSSPVVRSCPAALRPFEA